MAAIADPIPHTTVLVCGPNLRSIADPIAGWTNIDATLRHNAVSSGQVVTPADERLVAAATSPGARMVIVHEGAILISGPIEATDEVRTRRRSVLTIDFADHLALIADRVAYPNPAVPHAGQDVPHWAGNGVAETLMRDLVYLNVGQGALVERRRVGLTVGPSNGSGETVDFKALPYEPLGDALRRLALAGGGLGFRAVQDGLTYAFEVFVPRDRSRKVRYSEHLGNVEQLQIRRESPTATVAVVGILVPDDDDPDDEEEPPIVREVTNPEALAAWGRSETWVSQPKDADEERQTQAGNEALDAGGPKVGVIVTARDGPGQKYGVDYIVGDYVGVQLGNDQVLQELVTEVRVSITPKEGAVFTPKVGTGEASVNSRTAAALRDMDRRIGRNERS